MNRFILYNLIWFLFMYLLFIKFYLFSKKGYENCKNMKLKMLYITWTFLFFLKKIEKRSWNENWILIPINQEQNWCKTVLFRCSCIIWNKNKLIEINENIVIFDFLSSSFMKKWLHFNQNESIENIDYLLTYLLIFWILWS